MMPTIRIDDDVFTGLQKLAKPFVDTPNSVVRRLLEERGMLGRPEDHGLREVLSVPREELATAGSGGPGARKAKGEVTPQSEYEKWLNYILATEFKGRGEKDKVTAATIRAMKTRNLLRPVDFELVSTGETRAANTIAWSRNSLKERGLISRNSPRGVWELTPQGLIEGGKTPY